MSNRQAAVLVILIPSVGGFFIARQIAPNPPAPTRYEYLPFFKNAGVFRMDRQTGEVLLYEDRLQKRELVIYKGRLWAACQLRHPLIRAAPRLWRPRTLSTTRR